MRTAGLFLFGLFGGLTLRGNQQSSTSSSSSAFCEYGYNEPEQGNPNIDINAAIPQRPLDVFKLQNEGWYKHNRKVFSAKFRNYILSDVIPLTPDVSLFRFLLPEEDDEFNLKPCSTLQARVVFRGGGPDEIMRFYTPVTPNGTKGYFDIIVKRQRNGRMTNHLWKMRIGECLQFRNVLFKLRYRPNRWSEIGMIAGGTGFSPMLQIIHEALKPDVDPVLSAAEAASEKNLTSLSFFDEESVDKIKSEKRGTRSSQYFQQKQIVENEEKEKNKKLQHDGADDGIQTSSSSSTSSPLPANNVNNISNNSSNTNDENTTNNNNDADSSTSTANSLEQGRFCQALTVSETANRFVKTIEDQEYFAESGRLYALNDEVQRWEDDRIGGGGENNDDDEPVFDCALPPLERQQQQEEEPVDPVLAPYLKAVQEHDSEDAKKSKKTTSSHVIFDSHFFRSSKSSRANHDKKPTPTENLNSKNDAREHDNSNDNNSNYSSVNHEVFSPPPSKQKHQDSVLREKMQQMMMSGNGEESGTTLGSFSTELIEADNSPDDNNDDHQNAVISNTMNNSNTDDQEQPSSSPSIFRKVPPKKKKDPAPVVDKTKISFLFCNRSEHHILLKPLFEQLQRDFPDRFRVNFVVDRAYDPENWNGYQGWVTPQMIKETMPPPDKKKAIILLCGPDHLLERLAGTSLYLLSTMSKGRPIQPACSDLANKQRVSGILGSMGYTVENVYKF